MQISIYQINQDRDTNCVCFVSLSHLEALQGSVEIDSALYDKVFDGEVVCTNLEAVYTMFNLNRPMGFTGRFLSVSDIVAVEEGGDVSPGYCFCDQVGFQMVQFHPELTVSSPQNPPIRAVWVESEGTASVAYIDPSIESLQRLVQGYIQVWQPYEDTSVCVVCNENSVFTSEGDLGKEDGAAAVIHANFLVCGSKDVAFTSLTEDQARHYAELFIQPDYVRAFGSGKCLDGPEQDEPEL